MLFGRRVMAWTIITTITAPLRRSIRQYTWRESRRTTAWFVGATRSFSDTVMDRLRDQLKKKAKSDPSLYSLAATLRFNYIALVSPMATSTIHTGRSSILNFLANDLGPDEAAIQSTISRYQQHGSFPVLQAMREPLTPGYERLFQVILEDNAKEGMQFLVSLRQDLLQHMHELTDPDDTLVRLKQLDTHLQRILSTWFSPDMLDIRRITYQTTSAAVIEQIAIKEAVHPLQSLHDLKLRLGSDRRVFAAFHPLLPDVPLVFVHVALRSSIPTFMNDVLEPADLGVDSTTVAAFYSISSTQQGLSGIDLGQVLLKKAKVLLKEEFPTLETFVTLSPIPRFRKWLQEKLTTLIQGGIFVDETLLSNTEVAILSTAFQCQPKEAAATLLRHLDDPHGLMSTHATALKPVLMKLAASYLVHQKHRRKPLDGVARFHIHNGAEMYQLNYMADPSRKGFHNSLGIMVNYRYVNVEGNVAQYQADFHISVGERVAQWLLDMPPTSRL
jgi:malonyl-CoA decarboxylase